MKERIYGGFRVVIKLLKKHSLIHDILSQQIKLVLVFRTLTEKSQLVLQKFHRFLVYLIKLLERKQLHLNDLHY